MSMTLGQDVSGGGIIEGPKQSQTRCFGASGTTHPKEIEGNRRGLRIRMGLGTLTPCLVILVAGSRHPFFFLVFSGSFHLPR